MASENPSMSLSGQLPQTITKDKLTISCHCGHVKLELPHAPTSINECRCSVCYSYGALWAYYPRAGVMVTVAATEKNVSLQQYRREDEGSVGDLSFCQCGCITHWWGAGKYAGDDHKMGVNARMLPESALEGVTRKVSYK